MNTQYHLSFKQIEEETLIAVREIIKKGLFKKNEKSETERFEILKELNERLSKIYDVKTCELILHPGFMVVGGYSSTQKIIVVNKPNLVTFLHEFRHHLICEQNIHFNSNQDCEEDCRGWSHSVYYQSTPNLFRNAVDKGLLIFQTSIKEL
jgi:hypothetical protein